MTATNEDHTNIKRILILSSDFFGLQADGTADISANEQFSCCLQFVDSYLTAQNVFLGFYSACDSSAETLFSYMKYIFSI